MNSTWKAKTQAMVLPGYLAFCPTVPKGAQEIREDFRPWPSLREPLHRETHAALT